jgi:hypothetical protein
MQYYLRLALEVLHYIQEPVINIRLIVELDLNLVQVCEGILQNGKR